MGLHGVQSLEIPDFEGPEIYLDVEEVAGGVEPEISSEAEGYVVIGKGGKEYNSPRDALEAVEEGGLYVQGGGKLGEHVVVDGVEVVEAGEPLSNVYELKDLVEQNSDMIFTCYRHGGAMLSSGDSVEEALRELDGRNIALMGDLEDSGGEFCAQAGYVSGNVFGYREDTGKLTPDEQEALDAAVKDVLDMEDIPEQRSI